jgi:class 3 adenylate cyclase
MSDRAAGTITLVFTDIEGSTRLLQHLGDRYASVLGEHHRLVRGAFGAHGGVERDAAGDGLYFAFPSARGALAAAVDAQRALQAHDWPDGVAVRVRMGMHTGEVTSSEVGLVGIDVHRAARISAAGHGG